MRHGWPVSALLMLGGAAPLAAQSILYNNGVARGGAAPNGLPTGTTTSGGAMAPEGFQWSEVQTGNIVLGFSAADVIGNRLADDFVISDPGGWHITAIDVFGYITGAPTTGPSPFVSLSMQIWNGRPGDAGSALVFGDPTSNRLAGSVQVSILRGNAGGNSGGRVRSVWVNTAAVNTTLPPGHYWIDFSQDDGFNPPVTIVGSRGPANANARQFLSDPPAPGWTDMADPGPTGGPSQVQELPFFIRGQVLAPTSCYANCDGSTATPFLNVNDFLCFQALFAGGDPSANCDGSTTQPVLNINDFLCFQARFAAGCSAP